MVGGGRLRSGSPACPVQAHVPAKLTLQHRPLPVGHKLLLTLCSVCSTLSPVWEVFVFPVQGQDLEAQGISLQSRQLVREGLGPEPKSFMSPERLFPEQLNVCQITYTTE